MRYWSFDPWRQLRRIRSEMDRLSEQVGHPGATAFPPVNIWASQNGLVVTAELPGVDASDLDVSARRDTLTIRGSRPARELDASQSWHRRERRSGEFSRTIELPYTVDADSVDASYRDGILRIAMRRPEEDKPRRIEVQTA